MANNLTKTIVEEGARNFVVVLTGYLDTSDVTEVSVIKLGDCLDNDSQGPGTSRGNNHTGPLVGFRVDYITYVISNNLEVQLAWNAVNPQAIVPLAGRGKVDFVTDGGLVPKQSASGYDGSINLTTTGFGTPGAQPTQSFTVFLHLVKLYQPPVN